MQNFDLSSLEDLILNLYTEAHADRENAVLNVHELREDWRKIALRDADFVRGLSSLCESGMCRAIRDEHGLGVQLTSLGASYLRSHRSVLGLKSLASRGALTLRLGRLRKQKLGRPEHTNLRRRDDLQVATSAAM